MPTVTEPKLQPPMEAANPALKQGQAGVVTKQPTAEPQPTMDSELGLRGGEIICGCTQRCCGINCSWFPSCCR